MSDTSDSVRRPGSAEHPDSSTFKDFRKKLNDALPPPNPNNMQQDPGIHRKRNRIGRLLKFGSTQSRQEEENGSLTTAQKRRQQVYQAQKRHRSRKGEYIANLEAEIARLQRLDAVVNSESNALAHQNKAMKEFLAKQSIDIQLLNLDVNTSFQADDQLSQLGGPTLDVRFDEELGHERIFLDMPDFQGTPWTSSESASDGQQPSQLTRDEPVTGDSWAALDFILSLEWPCRPHVRHDTFNPNPGVSPACDQGYFHGHALTVTHSVLKSAVPSPQLDNAPSLLGQEIQQEFQDNTSERWMLPHSEIDKLVELAEMLEIDEDFITPAQAYAAVRETVTNEGYLRPVLEALKKPLGNLVECFGFGAGMDSAMFWKHLDATTQSLQFTTRPELGE